jgi:hypothetical protein
MSCALSAAKPDAMDNVVQGIVVRQLGSSRDYMVEIADGTQMRVVAPVVDNVPQAPVWLYTARALPRTQWMNGQRRE